jgi:hypothetical protein
MMSELKGKSVKETLKNLGLKLCPQNRVKASKKRYRKYLEIFIIRMLITKKS